MQQTTHHRIPCHSDADGIFRPDFPQQIPDGFCCCRLQRVQPLRRTRRAVDAADHIVSEAVL